MEMNLKSTFLVIISLLFALTLYAQSGKEKNLIEYIEIKVPVFVDIYTSKIYKDVKKEEEPKFLEDNKSNIEIKLRGAEIALNGANFSGSYQNKYFLSERYQFSGLLSEDRSVLQHLEITKYVDVNSNYLKQQVTIKIIIKDMYLYSGVYKFDKKRGKVYVSDYSSKMIKDSGGVITTTEQKFKKINYDDIPSNPAEISFKSFNLKLLLKLN